jgi:5-methylcytosine-specific restriction endonuclease McrA
MELDRYRTLLLDRTYRPILALPWRRAMLLVLGDRVEVLEYYPRHVHTATRAWPLPAVLRAPMRVDPAPRQVALTRRNVLLRDGHTCAYCGAGPSQKLTMDHVVPRSRGGASSWENIVTACATCNRRKSDRTPEEARMPLRVRPVAPTALQLGRRGMLIVGNPPEEWRPWLRS